MDFKNRNVLLFDLDGTLTDPKEGITTCVQVALERCGVTVEDRESLRIRSTMEWKAFCRTCAATASG